MLRNGSDRPPGGRGWQHIDLASGSGKPRHHQARAAVLGGGFTGREGTEFMPWSNQGGGGPWGPRGGGGNNGGGNGGGRGGGPQGPDLEELLRRGQDRVRGMLPGGFGGKGVILGALVVGVLWMFSGIFTVEPEEQGVVLRFGQYVRAVDPGLRYHLPFPIEKVIKVPVLTVRRVEIGDRGNQAVNDESLMLTGDENIIDVSFVVQWQVNDAQKFAFNIRNPDTTVKSAAESAMREVIGQTAIASALSEGRQEVASSARTLLQNIMDEYETGIFITELLLQRADPPQAVIDDYRDVQRARADQERLINEAQAYRNSIVPQSRGQASQIRNQAQAYKEQVVARAEGAASRFEAVYEQYRLAKDVTRQRIYLETMESVMRDMNKVIIDSAGGGAGVVPYLPLPEIQKRSAAARGAETVR
jgi:membrane protease subunit HflK